MGKNWLLYGAAVVGTLVFHGCYFGWYSWFLLLLVLCLPAFSLLVSLLAMMKVKIELDVPAFCSRGEPAYVTLRARGSFLPLPKCRFKLRITREMTGESVLLRQQIPGQDSWYVPLQTEHCGALRCSAEKGRVYDYLGLFWLPIRHSEPAELVVLPEAREPRQLPNLSHFLARRRKPKPGGGFSEEHELRDYRPGDSLRDIHWKLSVKTDRLLVREAQEPVREQTLLTFDLTGSPEQIDSVLEQLIWLSQWLLDHDTVHQICWIDPTNCRMAAIPVQAREDLDKLLERVLHASLQEDTPSIAERQFTGATWRHHVLPEEVGA